jgi:hypothetical protein
MRVKFIGYCLWTETNLVHAFYSYIGRSIGFDRVEAEM